MWYLKLFIFIGLFQQTPVKITPIEVNPGKPTMGELTMSSLVESIEYIPLETNDKCLIGVVGSSFDISDNYILVTCRKQLVAYLFNRNGRFICQIGDIGGGPGEYIAGPPTVFLDEKRKEILIVTNHQREILVYNLKGVFLRVEEIPSGELYGMCRLFYKDHFFLETRNYNGNLPFVYQIRSRDFKLISEDVKSVSFERRGNIWTGVGSPSKYIFEDKVHTKELSLNDTIYRIENDFSYHPKYVINAGKYEVTPELRGESDGNRYLKRIQEYASFKSFFETKNYLLLSYQYGGEKFYHCYYEKNKQKLFHFKSKNGIPNDFDGGIDFWPQKQHNNKWYAFYDAHLFEEQLSSEKKTTPKGSLQAQQAFNKVIKTIDAEDNPVLIIVKLKE